MPIKPSNSPDPSLGLDADIAEEFESNRVGARPHRISEYYRGGSKVPNIQRNFDIPTEGTVEWSDYYNATQDTPATGTVALANSSGTSYANNAEVSPEEVIYIDVSQIEDADGIQNGQWGARFIRSGAAEPNFTTGRTETNGLLNHTTTVTIGDAGSGVSIKAQVYLRDVNGSFSSIFETTNSVIASFDTSYSITPNTTTVTEGNSVNFVINVSNPLSTGEDVDWEINNAPDRINSNDTSGSISFTENQATVTVRTNATSILETNETFSLSLTGRTTGATAESADVTITNAGSTFSFVNSEMPASVDEGEDIVIPAGALRATNIDPDAHDYLLRASVPSSANWAFNGSTTRGVGFEFPFNSNTNFHENSEDITFSTTDDPTVFTDATVTLQMRRATSGSMSYSNIGPTDTVTVNNITPSPSYSITQNTTTLTEGNSVTFFIDSTNPLSGGETLNWAVQGIDSQGNVIDAPSRIRAPTSGSISYTSGQESVVVTANALNTLDATETFRLSVTGATTGLSATSSEVDLVNANESFSIVGSQIADTVAATEDIVIPIGALRATNIDPSAHEYRIGATTSLADRWVFNALSLGNKFNFVYNNDTGFYENDTEETFTTTANTEASDDATVTLQMIRRPISSTVFTTIGPTDTVTVTNPIDPITLQLPTSITRNVAISDLQAIRDEITLNLVLTSDGIIRTLATKQALGETTEDFGNWISDTTDLVAGDYEAFMTANTGFVGGTSEVTGTFGDWVELPETWSIIAKDLVGDGTEPSEAQLRATLRIRVAGDTNSNNWVSCSVNLGASTTLRRTGGTTGGTTTGGTRPPTTGGLIGTIDERDLSQRPGG